VDFFFLTLPAILKTGTKYCQLVCDGRPLVQKEMQRMRFWNLCFLCSVTRRELLPYWLLD